MPTLIGLASGASLAASESPVTWRVLKLLTPNWVR